jgi:hypothetical protein
MNVEMLAEKYGYNTPILLSQVEFEGITNNNLRQIFTRLKDKGLIEQYARGIYFIPKNNKLLSKNYLDTDMVIDNKYIQSIDGVNGYYTGLTFANQLGLTTQMPHCKEIVTNEESSNRREVKIGKTTVYLYKPRNHVTDYNWEVLQLLDFLARINNIGVDLDKENLSKIKKYISEENLERDILNKYINSYPGRVGKLLISEGLIDEFYNEQPTFDAALQI